MTGYGKAVGFETVLYRAGMVAIASGIALAPESSIALSGGIALLGLVTVIGHASVQADGVMDAHSLDDVLGVVQYGAFLSVVFLSGVYMIPSRLHDYLYIPAGSMAAALVAGIAIGGVRYLTSGRPFRVP